MNEMCNGDNYTYGGAYGSARKYFLDQSNNTYAPVFDVYGPIRVSRTRAYYGQNDEYGFDAHPEEAVAEACIIAHDSLGADFSLYDSDNDGEIDFVYMIYAGNGENITGQPSYLIWPHQGYAWNTQTFLDGKRLNKYACSAELEDNSTTQRCGIGTLCHEFSHVLGQPDYYDTEYGTNYSEALIPGEWDIMSSGSYNDDSRRPANYSVFEKYQFGWITPTNLNRTQDVTMEASKDYFYTSQDGNNKPYNTPDTVYYFENRQKTGWDQGLPGHGMLIWRVVYDEDAWSSNEPNNEPYKPRCMFIPADGTYLYGGDSGDPYPGTRRVTEFQVPNSIYSISQIFETAGKIQFHFVAGCDGYIADITASHVHITTPQESVCYPANQPFSMTVLPAKNYQLTDTSFTVIMGGTPLVEGVGYTFLNRDVTGDFAHNPEPLEKNLQGIMKEMSTGKYNLGIVVDPDVDRLAFICEDGKMFGEEYTLVSVADYVLSQTPGNTVSNLSSTRALRDVTQKRGGTYTAAAVGEVNVTTKMKEVNAVIGGEGNGGVIYPESHYGRDALVGIALFLTSLAKKGCKVSELRRQFPDYQIAKNRIDLTPETDVDAILVKVKEMFAKDPEAQVNDIDGVKIDFPDRWVHLRKSNTEPIIRVYSEASTMEQADELGKRLMQVVYDMQ